MSYRDALAAQLRVDEGEKLKLYLDTVGKWTIGVGRNLSDRGIRKSESDFMLSNDMDEAEEIARRLFKNFDDLSDARKAVVCNMSLNLGYTRLGGFVKFCAAVNQSRWDDAAIEMMDSDWALQVKDRAVRLRNKMKAG